MNKYYTGVWDRPCTCVAYKKTMRHHTTKDPNLKSVGRTSDLIWNRVNMVVRVYKNIYFRILLVKQNIINTAVEINTE